MKNLSYIIFFAILILFFSCKKEKNKEVEDEINAKYIGKYQVVEKISCYGSCSTCFSQKDTIISVRKGNSDSSLFVLNREVILNSQGEYYAYHYGLRFWDDSISSNHMNGGLACGTNISYLGIKISDVP